MTRALRRRHRLAVVVLALLLPLGVALALAARPVLPPVAAQRVAGREAPR